MLRFLGETWSLGHRVESQGDDSLIRSYRKSENIDREIDLGTLARRSGPCQADRISDVLTIERPYSTKAASGPQSLVLPTAQRLCKTAE